MRTRASLTATLAILTTLLSITITPTGATTSTGVNDPSNIWAPYGPLTSQVQLKFYSTPNEECNDLNLGQLDLPDVQCYPPTIVCIVDPCFGLPPTDVAVSQPVPQYVMYGIQFNLQNLTGPGITNTWANWGCNFQHGNSLCGIEIREALAHMLDRDSFVFRNFFPLGAQAIADPVSPAQVPSGSPQSTQCSWETITAYRNCTDAFHLATSLTGFAQPGSKDFCAAVAHLVNAGIGLTNNQNSCAIDPNSPGLAKITANPIRFIIRPTFGRGPLGTGLINAINQLFGVTAARPCQFGRFLGPCSPFNNPYGWDMYTFGFQLGPFADSLYQIFDSTLAPGQCGGPVSAYTYNYAFVCISSIDTRLDAASNTNDPIVFTTNTLAALNQIGSHAALIPVYTTTFTSTGLKDIAGRVNQQGIGYSNFWSALNGRRNQTYTPTNPIYTFGGGTGTLRWGQQGFVSSLNPYFAYFPSEVTVLGEIYDTLLRASPVEPTKVLCWMCDTYIETVDSSGNAHFLVELRQNLRWHDGIIVDAKDVKFSLLTLRDLSGLGYGASNVLNVQVLNPNLLDITMLGQSVTDLNNLATVPIIPRHIWELPGDRTYGDVGTVDPFKLDPSYDPMAFATLIGSGPYLCRSLYPEDQGRVGTGCSRAPPWEGGGRVEGQIDPGGTLILQWYDRTGEPGNVDPFVQYFRSYNLAWGETPGQPLCLAWWCSQPSPFSGQFQEFNWADHFDNATVTINDLVSVGLCLGKSDPSGCRDYTYWLRPAFHPNTPNTISSEVTIVASHLDDTWIFPFSWNGIQTQQPGQTLENIVPFTQ